MKPVKIEYLFDNKTSDGFESLNKSVNDSATNLKEKIREQKAFVAELKQQIQSVEREISRASDDSEKKKLIPSLLEAERELKTAETSLSELETQLGGTSGKQAQLRTQIMNLKNEMAKMTEGTDEYRAAMEKLGEMQDRYGDISQQGRVLADDEKYIRATADAVAGLSGAMSAGVGVASLLGAGEEELVKIQTKLQAVMATTIGLQQVAQTLNKDSYFSIVLLAGAKKKWAAAQELLNTQLKIGAVASKALMISGVGLLIVGITALVVAYDKWKKKQDEIKEQNAKLKELQADAAKNIEGEVAKLQELERVASDVTKPQKDRINALNTLNKLMPAYNGHLAKETGALIANKNALLEYIQALANMEVAKNIAMENAKRTIQIAESQQLEKDYATGKATAPKKYSAPGKYVGGSNVSQGTYIEPSAKAIKEANNANIQAAIESERKKQAELKKENEKGENLIKELTKNNVKLLSDLNASTNRTAEKATPPENRLSEMRIDALRKIKEEEISLMKEGEEKRKAQAELEYKNRLDEIGREKAEYDKHVRELQKAGVSIPETEINGYNDLSVQQAMQAKKKYDSQIRQIDEETANLYKSIQNDLKLNFETRLNQELADIDNYYGELAEKAKGNSELLAQIDDARLKEKRQKTGEAQLREIELETELALRKQEIDDRQTLLATDRQEKLLRIELDGHRKRLAKLEEMQRNGADVAEDIKLTRSEIDKLSASLKKIPTDRVREIGLYLKDWLNTLSGVGGELGESLSGIAAGVDMVTAALDKEATTRDQVGIAIDGLVKLYGMASSQLEENRQKQAEWNEKIDESVQKAKLLRIEQLEYNRANIFGVENPYAKAVAGANQYRQAMKELNSSLNRLSGGQIQTGTKKVVSGSNIAGGAGAGAGVGAAVGSIIPGVGTAIGAAIGGLLGGIFGATQKKVVPVFDSLQKKFGSILKSGTETFELNPAILENYAKLDDATKKLVDNWEQIREKALDAQEQMRQTFADLAGDIGNSLSSALIDSFRNDDLYAAVDVFDQKITGTIENILGQLVFSAHFQKMFDELQKRMEDSFSASGDESIVDDIVWFSNNYKDKIAAYGKNMEEVRDEMKRQGFDLFMPDAESSRSAASKGISGLSQDQGNKLEGQLTNVQGRLMNIDKNVIDMANFLFRIFDPISRIADNTDRLEAIETSMESVKTDISKMVRDGLFLKR